MYFGEYFYTALKSKREYVIITAIKSKREVYEVRF